MKAEKADLQTLIFAGEYSVHRGILDYTVRFPDGDVMRIAPVQQLLVERDGQHIPLAAYDATNEEIIDAAIMIRNDLREMDLGKIETE
jgi:hypothetical protein